MADEYNLFISWSGPRSLIAAEALRDWLPSLIQVARPWLSASDLDKGTLWPAEIMSALETVKAGIICLTPENLKEEWLLFEAGALAKARDLKSRVWTYVLADLEIKDLRDPLKMFNATTDDEKDTRKLIHSINKYLGATVAEKRLDHLFDKLWPDFEEKLKTIPEKPPTSLPEQTPEQAATLALELLRTLAPKILDIAAEADLAKRKRLADEAFRSYVASLPPGTNVITASPLGASSGYLADANILSNPWTTLAVHTPPSATPPSVPDAPHLPSSPRRKMPILSRKGNRAKTDKP